MQRHRPPPRDLHATAISLTAQDLSLGPHYYCAILKHTKAPDSNPQEEDFIWAKCKGTHTVQKLQKVYKDNYTNEEDVILKLSNDTFPDSTTTLQSLDIRGDRVVVFSAILADASRPHTTMNRQPLQPVNSQMAMPQPSHPKSEPFIKPEMSMSENMTMDRIPHSNGATSAQGSSSTDGGFENFQKAQVQQLLRELTPSEIGKQAHVIKAKWDAMTVGQRAPYNSVANSTSPFLPKLEQSIPVYRPAHGFHNTKVKHEDNFSASGGDDSFDASFDNTFEDAPEGQSRLSKAAEKSRLQKMLSTVSPEVLESEVRKGMDLLGKLARPLNEHKEQSEDARQWLSQIEGLQNQSITTPTVIGVVGNTGAGKSSVINAMLDEERLVPTNCMRACTAVVTEMSWNSSDEENKKYRASIEFIKAEDWEKELKMLFEELLDPNGSLSRECANPESEAGVAYAKIKAVYPTLTKEEMANSTVDQLMLTPAVRAVLGTTKDISHRNPDDFYRRLQHYVDSKEKNEGKGEKSGKGSKSSMEFWPLIKVVKIYTKSDALSTGAIIVDLPGVQDSNAARAAVAQNYMKRCSGLWIVAPINRAVDDKAAKSLMGDSFKRQLKYDGTYSQVTFICSKTDDISITEAVDSLGIQDDVAKLWAKSDKLGTEKKGLEKRLKDLKESKQVYTGVFDDADEKLEAWEAIQSQFEEGETVYAPSNKPPQNKKRKRSESSRNQRKKRKNDSDGSDDDFESVASAAEESDADESDGEDANGENRKPLTEEDIDSKIRELKANKKQARREKSSVESTIKEVNEEKKEIQLLIDEIDAEMNSLCISGRNKYSKAAIQLDFAAGIKELDQENSLEDDEENFNPDEEIRDYDEVAKSLPVFCVSSRGYQKLCGRLKRDNKVNGFKTIEETEIPQLQEHCKRLTDKGRASNCRKILNSLNQLTNSLALWASNEGNGMNLTDEQKANEAKNLLRKLDGLEKGFDKIVENCIKDLKETLEDNIYDQFDNILPKAIENAPVKFSKWTSPVNRVDRSAGGYHFSTFKALVRRSGVFTNAQGPHDWNEQLCEPIMKDLGNNWEKVFIRRLPVIFSGFARDAKTLLAKFHSEIHKRCLERGVGIAGMNMLGQQLDTYDTEFKELVQAVNGEATNFQRDASRGFQPVIRSEMEPTYTHCASDSGPGVYMRSKDHMRNHIDQNKTTMFENSTGAVKEQLKAMCRAIEAAMAQGADEAFIRIRRDYMQVVGGVRLPQGEVPSKAERVMRASIVKILEDFEKVKEEDGQSPNAQLKNEADEAADRMELDVPGNRSSTDASSEKVADSEEDESEDDNDESSEDHSDREEKDEDAVSVDED